MAPTKSPRGAEIDGLAVQWRRLALPTEGRTRPTSQPELARAAGLHVETLRRIEQRRRTRVALPTLAALAEALGCKMQDLLKPKEVANV